MWTAHYGGGGTNFSVHAPMGCNEIMAYSCAYLSVYLFTIRKCSFSNIHWWIFMILGHNDHQVGDNRGDQEFGVKGHLGSLFKYTQYTSSSTWINRFRWNSDEEILGQRFFRGVQEFLIGGHLGVIWGHCWRSNFKQSSTTNLTTLYVSVLV